MNPVMLRRIGTRHRAAIGITEESDALAVIVSEETGQISIASRGDLETDVILDRVRERLTRHGSGRHRKTEPEAEPRLKQAQP
jgi:diadenylate cyclase